ncbi:MAG: hypothetical protein SLAVMIC_00292 [uncultured marine phage]|uniref:Uncharacterized protein n=1 Tax=uncultured marine phage TaxID=707152 RepID=A0A8D9CCT6_9VIRU|nr:MAG: hypothetical protein SLAVMIC_00292 [uncultured marine phage]
MKIRKFNEDNEIDWKSQDKGKIEYYNKIFSLFLDKLPSDDLYEGYFHEEDARYMQNEFGDGSLAMQDFINMNLKNEFQWVTGLGIMDAADQIVDGAIGNGNILRNER